MNFAGAPVRGQHRKPCTDCGTNFHSFDAGYYYTDTLSPWGADKLCSGCMAERLGGYFAGLRARWVWGRRRLLIIAIPLYYYYSHCYYSYYYYSYYYYSYSALNERTRRARDILGRHAKMTTKNGPRFSMNTRVAVCVQWQLV